MAYYKERGEGATGGAYLDQVFRDGLKQHLCDSWIAQVVITNRLQMLRTDIADRISSLLQPDVRLDQNDVAFLVQTLGILEVEIDMYQGRKGICLVKFSTDPDIYQ